MKKYIIYTIILILTTNCSNLIIDKKNINKKFNPEREGLVILGLDRIPQKRIKIKNLDSGNTNTFKTPSSLTSETRGKLHFVKHIAKYPILKLEPGNYKISVINNYKERNEYESPYFISFKVFPGKINYIGSIINKRFKSSFTILRPEENIFQDNYKEAIEKTQINLKINKKLAKSNFLTEKEILIKNAKSWHKINKIKCEDQDFSIYPDIRKYEEKLCKKIKGKNTNNIINSFKPLN